MNFKYGITKNRFSFFFLNASNKKVEFENWEELQSEFISQLVILSELIDNGIGEQETDCCLIDIQDILKLSDIDKQILGLPTSFPYEIFIESDGVLSQPTFKFKYGFYDFSPNGNNLNGTINGAIVTTNSTEYLLSENQYLVCNAISEFNNLSNEIKGNIVNLKKLAEIKSLSNNSGLILEQFLYNQELYLPDKIKIDIDFKNGILDIVPNIEIEDNRSFTNTFDKLPSVRDVYPITNNKGLTTRVVFSENQKTELQKLKKNRQINDPQIIAEIVEHPELFFEEEEVDFSVFYSERVKEIGLYSPKFYPFACPYKSEWIPGIVIKDKVIGEKRILLKSPEILADFIEKKEFAVKTNETHIIWEDIEIPINEAEKLISVAIRQFENPKEPVKNDSKTDTEVLIIKENAESTEFSNFKELPKQLNHIFHEIRNLSDGVVLKEHQKEGISWLQSLLKDDLAGGLLADDMGLGKTLQLLYFIEWHSQFYNSGNKPYLIVAPVSLLENWENEYQKFFSPQNLPLIKLYGSISLTKENNLIKNQQDARRLQQKQIILTNYDTLRLYQISLGLVDFAVVALDEAQKIKTPGTLITNATKALKADFKIAMTGTPVENTLVDIWCIMDFAVPGLLGNAKDFAKQFQRPLINENTDIKELTENLRNKIGIFIKRRLKIDVAKDLPKKHDSNLSRRKKVMPFVQLQRYKLEIQMANDTSLEGVDSRNQKLKSIWAIRDISDHPYILESQILNFSSDELISSSSKLQTTMSLIEDIKQKEDKVIVFADRKEIQKMLQKVFYDKFAVFSSIINGDTPSTKLENRAKLSRQQTIDRFQGEVGFNIIIMSPLAAGVGLNVTEANHIIHYSRHWNPAKEEQATDRAYRIGQKKEVFVYYPMAIFPDEMKDDLGNKLKSFDEILDILLENKKKLASNTLFPTEQSEIKPDELYGNIFSPNIEVTNNLLSISDLDKLNPNLFESSIATLYKKQGFDVYVTPYSNDKGVDVVALKNNENYILQVKQTKSVVGIDAIQEICTAKKYYEEKFNVSFRQQVITNSFFSSSAELLSKSNDIELIGRERLGNLVNEFDIFIQEIHQLESQRLSKI